MNVSQEIGTRSLAKIWRLLLALAVLCLAAPAWSEIYAGSGELGIDVGLTSFDDDIVDDTSFRFNIRGGYYFSPFFELEGQYVQISADEDDTDVTLEALFVNAVFNFRPHDSYTWYTLIGIGTANVDAESAFVDADDDSLAFQSAVGIRFFLSKNLDARIEFSGMTEDTFNDSSQHFSLVGGLSWTFGH
jgi:opacity protein-like surface antigen